MIERFKKLFSRTSAPPEAPSDAELRLAGAVLMVEAAHMDADYDVTERRTIAAALRRHFRLDELETAALLDMAERVHENATEFSRFTKTIKDRYSSEKRIEMIEMLWEVVYADGELHAYEANLMRRLGGLLYVTEQERGDARKRVLQRMGISP